MKRLSNKQKLALAGIAVYVVAYNAGKKDGISLVANKAKQLDELNQNIGYMRALNDFAKNMSK